MYQKMMEEAKKMGIPIEMKMTESVEEINELLRVVKKDHPKEYWTFLRKQHGVLFKGHYDQVFAEWDVAQIEYTDKAGMKRKGYYWTCEQIEEATKGMVFPEGVNKWDKYVAFNAAYSDFCKDLDDGQILKIAYSFYFADEDWPGGSGTKIWNYMSCKNQVGV